MSCTPILGLIGKTQQKTRVLNWLIFRTDSRADANPTLVQAPNVFFADPRAFRAMEKVAEKVHFGQPHNPRTAAG